MDRNACGAARERQPELRVLASAASLIAKSPCTVKVHQAVRREPYGGPSARDRAWPRWPLLGGCLRRGGGVRRQAGGRVSQF